MNILVITDQFIVGGLETHINTYYESLKKNNNFVFIFDKYVDNGYLKDAKIYCDNFHFNFNVTISEFCEDVQRILNIIIDEKIDIIHVHPFYCLFPTIFAANIAKKKIVFTCHGRGSVTYYNGINDTLLYSFAIKEYISKIFCVSDLYKKWLDNPSKNAVFIPNIVDEKQFPEHKISSNKIWALVSRLDNGKIEEIEKLLLMLPDLDIKEIHIYGTGNMEKELKKFVNNNHLKNKVLFKGYTNNLSVTLNNSYNGVIGQGRVAIESLTMNYPTILIGYYNKIVGVIDDNKFNVLKKVNFVPIDFEDVSVTKLQKEIKLVYSNPSRYQLRNMTTDFFGTKNFNTYLRILKNTKFKYSEVLNECFNEITQVKDNEMFYNSYNIFIILKKYIGAYTMNPELKMIMNSFDNINILNNEQNIKLIEKEIKSINAGISDLNKKIDNCENYINTMTLYSLFKQQIKNILNKFRKKEL